MPADTDPPAKWARWYRDVCGWLVFPTRCDEDVEGYARFLERQALSAAQERGDVDAEQRSAIRAEAQEEAERTRKAPLPKWEHRDAVSDYEIDAWWGDGRGPKRGIWVAMGRVDVRSLAAKTATAVVAVDVDPRAGGSVEEWSSLEGPLAETPSGGCHVLCLSTPALRCSVGEVAPGVDVRASGGGIVVPSGSSSPGRRWKRWQAPVAPPEAVTQAKDKTRSAGPGETGRSGVDGSARTASTFAEILATTAPDGTRNATAAQIVGVLARPQSIPEDALDAALAMLADAGEEDIDGWRTALTRGPRGPEEAVAFLCAWNASRGDPPWSDSRCERTARSLWKTADRREGGNAGAEDFGVTETWDPSGVPSVAVVGDGLASQGLSGSEGAEAETGAATPQTSAPLEFKPKPKEIPAGFCLPLSVAFPASRFRELREVVPISIAFGPKWMDDRLDRGRETSAEFGYGLGKWMEEEIGGGLNPNGSFIAIGALMAKSGKTNLVGQLVEGLALESARRIMHGKDGWITPVFWLTEMMPHSDVSVRMVSRYLGVDSSFWTRGIMGHEAPGVIDLAMRLNRSKEDTANIIDTVTTQLCNTPNEFSLARSITVNLDTHTLPRKRGRNTADPRLGIALLDMAELAVLKFCEDLAQAHGLDPERIKPIVIADPVHRFADMSNEDRLTAVNLVIHRLREMCQVNKWIVMATSDTTKAGSGGDKGMEGDPGVLAAAAFAGTNNLTHEPDTVVVIRPGEDLPMPRRLVSQRPVLARVCFCRRGTRSRVLSYKWIPHCGRYYAEDPATLEDKSQAPAMAAPTAPIKRTRGRPRKSV